MFASSRPPSSRAFFGALLCAPSLLAALAADAAGRTPPVDIVLPATGHCIAPLDEIRRTHPDLLKHQRDRTVHDGERGARVSLKGCVDCHADPTTGSVLGSDHAFCQGCHAYAAVHIDCFECHSASVRPAGGAVAESEKAK